MNRLFKLIIIAEVMVLGSFVPAEAADRRGNGGDVVVCGVNNVRLLDFYEAEKRFEWTLDLGGDDLSLIEKVQRILDKLYDLDYARYKLYSERLAEFDEDVHLWPGIELTDVPDSEHVGLEIGCRIEQIAVQIASPLPAERRYTISKDLWDRLTKDHKAGLILHEIVYREAIELGQPNSIAARYFTGALASREFESWDVDEYERQLRALKYPYTRFEMFEGLRVKSRQEFEDFIEVKLHPVVQSMELDGRIIQIKDAVQFWKGDSLRLKRLTPVATEEFETVWGTFALDGALNFFENGIVACGRFAQATVVPIHGSYLPLAGSFRPKAQDSRCPDNVLPNENTKWLVNLAKPALVPTLFGKIEMEEGSLTVHENTIAGRFTGSQRIDTRYGFIETDTIAYEDEIIIRPTKEGEINIRGFSASIRHYDNYRFLTFDYTGALRKIYEPDGVFKLETPDGPAEFRARYKHGVEEFLVFKDDYVIDFELVSPKEFEINGCMTTLNELTRVIYGENLNLKFLYEAAGSQDICVQDPGGTPQRLRITTAVWFYEDGPVEKMLDIDLGGSVPAATAAGRKPFRQSEELIFYRSGYVKSGALAEDAELLTDQGELQAFYRGNELNFNERGEVVTE